MHDEEPGDAISDASTQTGAMTATAAAGAGLGAMPPVVTGISAGSAAAPLVGAVALAPVCAGLGRALWRVVHRDGAGGARRDQPLGAPGGRSGGR